MRQGLSFPALVQKGQSLVFDGLAWSLSYVLTSSATLTATRIPVAGVSGVLKDSQIVDGVTGNVLTIAGTLTAARTVTFPDAAVTIPAGTLIAGTLANANRLDSTSAAGVIKESLIADGISTSVLTIAGTLTAPRTLTLPDAAVTIPAGTLLTGTLANANRLDSTSAAGVVKESQIADGVTGSVLTISGTLTAPRTLTLPDAAVTIPAGTLLTGTLANANRLDSTSAAGIVKESQIADGVTGSVLTIAGTLTGLRTQTARDASGNLCLDSVDNGFSAGQTITAAAGLKVRQGATTDAIVVAPANIGSSSNTITETTPATALGANFIQTRQAATGTMPLIEIQPVASFQNKLINPRFEIAQRGTTFTPTLNTETYDLDRFFTKIDGTSLVFTVSQQAHTLGTLINEPAFFRRCAISTAGTASTVTKILAQRIEGVRPYSNKSLIVTFKAKADATRTVTPNYVQCFGTGGAPSANVTGAGSGIALTTSWVTYTQVITLPSISGKTMGTTIGTDYLELWLSAAANTAQTIDISDIEFKEVATSGQVNSPFEIRPAQVELVLCQRYFEVVAQATGGSPFSTQAQANLTFSCQKRAIPTVTAPVAMRWTDGIANFTQSAVNPGTYIGDASGGILSGIPNFSGMTIGRFVQYFPASASDRIYASSEL